MTLFASILLVAGEHLAWGASFADPTLWQVTNGQYRAWATPGGAFMKPYLTSTNAMDWCELSYGPIDAKLAKEIRAQWKAIWAPDRAVVGGEELLYVSLVNHAEESAIGVFKLDAEGRASDLAIVTSSRETAIKDTIDPEVVTDPETGRVWLFFGSTGKMHRVELAKDGRSVLQGAKYEHVAGFTDDVDPSRRTVFEGAYLLNREGWWYLFVSAGWYGDASYNLRVGRSRTLEGAFVDREGRLMTDGFATPVLATEKISPFYGPGHNGDVLVTADGQERLFYHSHYRALDNGEKRPRVMLSRRLSWTKDGWPRLLKD